MFCRKCGGKLRWNLNFERLICESCKKEHNPIEIRDRMWKDINSFTDYDFEFDENSGKKKKKKKKDDDDGMLTIDLSRFKGD